jgi:glycosyltransferase involved in cell wall biosynthesis
MVQATGLQRRSDRLDEKLGDSGERSTPHDRARVRISVCSPVHNEALNLREFVARVAAALESAGYTNWEAVLVDDGSTDGSGDLLDRISEENQRVRVLHHAANLGEWAAWKTAFAASRGSVACMLASDLQPPPEELPKLLDLVVIDGYDVGTGRRKDRKDGYFYRAATFLLTRFANLFWDLRVRDVSSSFFAVRGDLARQARMVRNDHRYILAIFRAMGASIAEVDTSRHQPRRHGHSHYKKSKVIRAIPEVMRFTMRLLKGYYAASSAGLRSAA